MGNLIRLGLIAAVVANSYLSKDGFSKFTSIFNSDNKTSSEVVYDDTQEYIRQLQQTKHDIDKWTFTILKYTNQHLPVKNIRFYDCYDRSVGFDIKGKKVKLVEPGKLEDYVSMIDPNSRRIKTIVSKIKTKGKTTLESAEDVFYAVKNTGLKYASDPNCYPLEIYDESKGPRPDTIPPNVDYVRHAEQTDKDGEGDCEDMHIEYASCLLSKGIPAALLVTPNSPGDNEKDGHAFMLIKIKKSEFDVDKMLNYIVDSRGNYFIPVDITCIGRGGETFEKARIRGMNAYRYSYPAVLALIPRQYKHLFE